MQIKHEKIQAKNDNSKTYTEALRESNSSIHRIVNATVTLYLSKAHRLCHILQCKQALLAKSKDSC